MFALSRGGAQISLQIQFCSHLFASSSSSSWAKSACSSSAGGGLVRYIPGTYAKSKAEKAQKSPTLKSCDGKDSSLLTTRVYSGARVAKEVSSSRPGDASLEEIPINKAALVAQSESGLNSSGDARCIHNEIKITSKTKESYGDMLSLKKSSPSMGGRIIGKPSNSGGQSHKGNSMSAISDGEFLRFGKMSDNTGELSAIEDTTYSQLDPVDMDSEYMKTCNTKEDVQNMAFKLLAARAYTTSELHKKLIDKKYPMKRIESVIVNLQSRGFLNDGLYAESFSRSRWLSLSWGPRRIKRALLEKGISEEDADKATCQVFEDDDSGESDKGKVLGMSKLTFDRLFAQASKQWLRGQDKSLEKRRSSIMRWLQYRGFDWGVTKFLLKKLEIQYPP